MGRERSAGGMGKRLVVPIEPSAQGVSRGGRTYLRPEGHETHSMERHARTRAPRGPRTYRDAARSAANTASRRRGTGLGQGRVHEAVLRSQLQDHGEQNFLLSLCRGPQPGMCSLDSRGTLEGGTDAVYEQAAAPDADPRRSSSRV
eukprot:1819103-Pleurochrysis_carterae.AAC.1